MEFHMTALLHFKCNSKLHVVFEGVILQTELSSNQFYVYIIFALLRHTGNYMYHPLHYSDALNFTLVVYLCFSCDSHNKQ